MKSLIEVPGKIDPENLAHTRICRVIFSVLTPMKTGTETLRANVWGYLFNLLINS